MSMTMHILIKGILLAASVQTGALPIISISDLTAMQGGTASLALQLSDIEIDGSGGNATIALPEGIEIKSVHKGSTLGDFIVDFHQAPGSNEAAVLLYSLTDTFGATSLDLAELTVEVSKDVAPGDYEISIIAEKSGISNEDGSVSVPFEVASGILTVTEAEPMPLFSPMGVILGFIALAAAGVVATQRLHPHATLRQ